MQEACPATESPIPENSSHRPPLTPPQRRIILAMLIGLHLFIATLDPYHMDSALTLWTAIHFGCWLVPLFLAGAWGSMSTRPIITRLSEAFGLASFIGIAREWGSSNAIPWDVMPLWNVLWMSIVPCLALLLLFAILQKFCRWRIVVTDEQTVSGRTRLQFTMRQMLLWMAGLATFLGIARSITPNLTQTNGIVYSTVFEYSSLIGILLTAFIFIAGAVLSDTCRRRFAIGTIILLPFSSVLLIATILSIDYFNNRSSGGDLLEAVTDTAIVSTSFIFSFVTASFATFIVLRYCGYRLVQVPKKPNLDEIDSSNPVAINANLIPQTTAARRSPFPYLVATIALVGLFLCWPAYEIHLANRQYAADRALEKEWEDVGANVFIQYGEITNLVFDQSSVKDAALEKLQKLGKEEHIGNLVFVGASLTNDQLNRLGKAKSFYSLQISSIPLQDGDLIHLKALTQITQLDFRNTSITDAGLEHLQGFKKLRYLNLSGTKVTDAGIEKLKKTLPNCTIMGGSRSIALPIELPYPPPPR